MIDWVDCTTVMIGRPSPKIFPSILNICVPCRCVSRSEAHGWVKDTCALSKGALDQCRLKVLAWGENGSMPLSADNISASHRLKLHRKCARSDLSTARHLGQDAEEDAAPDTGAIYLPQNPGCDLERPGEHGIKTKRSRKSGSLRNSSDVRLKGELQ